MENEILAVDIGGPILNAKGGSSPETYRAAPQTEGAFPALHVLHHRRFHRRIHVISQCNEEIQAIKLDWFARHRFHELTHVDPAHVHFVREQAGKAALCKELGVTHFVDDRPPILAHAVGVVPNLFAFRPDPFELGANPTVMLAAREVDGWPALLRLLLPSG